MSAFDAKRLGPRYRQKSLNGFALSAVYLTVCRLGGIHGGKKNAPDDSGAITFSGTCSGTLVGARSGAGAGAGV
jgi:hypothetical protein